MAEHDDKNKPGPEVTVNPDGEDRVLEGDSSDGEEVRKLEISEELRAALEEAEASVAKKRRKEEAASSGEEAAESGDFSGAEADEEDVDVEIEEEEGEKEEDFDPNKVDEYEKEAAPPRQSKEEMELKMQILELRQKLREKEAELEQKLKEIKQNAEQARHIQKQFDSYKARMNKEKSDWFNYGHEPILKELLGVKDNLERAIHHAEETPEIQSLREGVKLTLRQFNAILEKFGVSSIKAQGEPFNPEYHQAMMQVEDNSVPGGTVIDEHQSGYLLKDRLLRPSMVTVSKRTAPEGPEEKESETVSESEETDTDKADSGPEDVPGPGGDE